MADTYLKLYNNNPVLDKLFEFSSFYHIAFTEEYKLEDFFNQNRETIFSQLSVEQKKRLAHTLSKSISELTSEDIDLNIELPIPCYLFIPDKYVSYSLAVKHTNFQAPIINAIAFEDEQIKSIFQDSSVSLGDSKRMSPGCRVLGWFKTMYFSNKIEKNTDLDNIYNLKQSFLDLSKYVVSLNTNVGDSGGSFTLSLPHIPLYSSSVFSSKTYSKKDVENGNIFLISSNEQNSSSEQIRSSSNKFDYFNWLIQPNDLLFISFDNMKDLTDDNLSGNSFDMICLVDSVSMYKDSQGNASVSVSGRDLMKLITDDSSLFFRTSVSSGNLDIFNFDNTETLKGGGDYNSIIFNKEINKSNLMRFPNGSLKIFTCEANDFSIDFVIKTIIYCLTNIYVAPNDLFVSWGNKRTTVSTLKPKE